MARKRHLKWCDGDVSVVLEFTAPKDSAHAADLRTMFDEVSEAYKRFARRSRDGAQEAAALLVPEHAAVIAAAVAVHAYSVDPATCDLRRMADNDVWFGLLENLVEAVDAMDAAEVPHV